jgi:hypothetical protein
MLKDASLHVGLTALMASVAVVAIAGQESKHLEGAARIQPSREKSSGVVIKVERTPGDPERKSFWRMTVNTDVVWRDFVRDQAVDPNRVARTGIAKAASKGKESIAVKGHPTADPLLLSVDLDPQTEVTVRYRSSTDAMSEGSATPDGASRSELANEQSGKSKTSNAKTRPDSKREVLKPRTLEPMELKPGLWVDVEFRHNEAGNRARRVTVLRPVGGPDTPSKK